MNNPNEPREWEKLFAETFSEQVKPKKPYFIFIALGVVLAIGIALQVIYKIWDPASLTIAIVFTLGLGVFILLVTPRVKKTANTHGQHDDAEE